MSEQTKEKSKLPAAAPVKGAPATGQTPVANPTVARVGDLCAAVGADGIVRPFRIPEWAKRYANAEGLVALAKQDDGNGWLGSNGHKPLLATVYTAPGIAGCVVVQRPDYNKGVVRYIVCPLVSAEAI